MYARDEDIMVFKMVTFRVSSLKLWLNSFTYRFFNEGTNTKSILLYIITTTPILLY